MIIASVSTQGNRFRHLHVLKLKFTISTFVVNAVLLKLRPELYQSRYNSSSINVNRDTTLKRSMPNQWARSHRL